MRNVIFYLGIGFLFTHELDAVRNSEWRVMPLLGALPDDTGMTIFIAAHVPLFALVIGALASSNRRVQTNSRLALCVILVLHGLLHAVFMQHPDYEFYSVLSNVLIFGGAVLGIMSLALERRNLWGSRLK